MAETNPRFPTDSAPAPRIRSLLETRIIQPADGLGPPWQIAPFNTGDQVIVHLNDPLLGQRSFIHALVLEVPSASSVKLFLQDGTESIRTINDFRLRNVNPEGIRYFFDDPVHVRVHDPAQRTTGRITKTPEAVGKPDTFEVRLDSDSSLILTPLNAMVLNAGIPDTVRQVQANHNVQMEP
ncbi:hypothetical protein LCGC14_0164800 [marine sediment metagenome]|uniref:Uncharacterized protein n=1 Tax=marine sediment metagenome TaxID=412755 RepID=A0A0F9XCY1_9ZZZZ